MPNILVAFCLYFFSANGIAADLFDMLKRISDADQQQNYQGTFILRKSDELTTLHVTHGIDDKGVWESLETLNGEPQKILRHNNRVISVFPDRELITVRHNVKKQALHPKLPDNIEQFEQFYSMQQLEDDRIANHPSLVVDLLPNDQYRYGYRYWVDKNTGMLLRCDLLNEDHVVMEQMMFTALDYLPKTPSQTFEIQQFEQFEQQLLDEPEMDVETVSEAGWRVARLPEGFMLTQSTMRYSQPSASITSTTAPDLLHLVYSDGLASVSVFVEENQGVKKHLQGFSSKGAVNAFGQSVGDHFVTVVGEVPAETVQLMAQSAFKEQ